MIPKQVLNILASWILYFALCSNSHAQTTTSIGAILPLSGDGVFWGENPRNGIQLALEDLRIAEQNTRLRVIFEDDRCNAKDAVAAFRKLVDIEKVKVILGPSCSSAAAALAPLAERARVLLVFFAESDEVKPGPYVLRLWVPNSRQGRLLAEYAFNQNFRTVGILSTQNAFGSSISKAFADRFAALGGNVVSRQDYDPSAVTFRSELLRTKAANPDAVFFASYIKDGAILVREARQLGFSKPLLGASTINSPEFFGAAKSAANGIVFADLFDSSSQVFRQKWQAKFATEYPGMQSGAALMYDVTLLLGRWSRNNKDFSGMGDLLRSVDYSGASGRIVFTSDGNLDRNHSLYRITNERPELLSE